MNDHYLSFETFTEASQSAPLQHFTSAGIIHFGRRFWSEKLARWLGKRGKPIRYFIDDTGPLSESAIAFRETGEFLDNVPEVGRPLAS
jgi:hypothetical protein